jgi:hypothetical protein
MMTEGQVLLRLGNQAEFNVNLQKFGGVVFNMERHGVPIDREVCKEIQ